MNNLRFIVFSAGFNCEKWVKKNILSVKKQSYRNFIHVVIDDATTDGTWEIIRRHRHRKLAAHRNRKNIRWIGNAVKYIDHYAISEEDVVVIVDLDDWLAGPDVLQKLHDAYTGDEGYWMTCGGYSEFIGKGLKRIHHKNRKIENKRIRSLGYFTHLKTFKYFLWDNINKNDLKGPNGKYVSCTYDRAIMYPMAEMTPAERIYFFDEMLYIYNRNNPLNVSKIEQRKQKKIKEWFKGKKAYKRLKR